MSSSHPALDPPTPHPLATSFPSESPPRAPEIRLRSLRAPQPSLAKLAPTAAGPVEVAADYTLVSFMEHSRPLCCRPSQATDLQRDAFCVSASAHCRGSAPCAWLGQGPPGAP